MDNANKHYVIVDEHGRIVGGFSDAFRQPSESDICITAQGGYQFRLHPDGAENPPLFKMPERVPLYKWVYGTVAERTAEEIAADIAELPVPEKKPDRTDMIEAQAIYTAMMTDTLLEV